MVRDARRKVAIFLQLPIFVQFWVPLLWVLLGFTKALIFTLPFRVLAPNLGQQIATPRLPILTKDLEERARLIGQAIQLSAKYTPWESNCLPQAITARMLLGLYRIPYALYFGLRSGSQDSDLKAHAWICAGKVNVTGGACFEQFTVVGVFVSNELID